VVTKQQDHKQVLNRTNYCSQNLREEIPCET
jgi:hypothetical protein